MMRSIRANTKWFMLVMAAAFAGWLVFQGIQQLTQTSSTGPNPVIAVVNGQEIRYTRWNSELDATIERARQSVDRPLTDEETRQVRQQAWEQMINSVLVEQELDRLGIEVTDSEVRQAFRLSPPPDLMRHPAFQTNGRFDYEKYQAFFADPSVDEQLLRQIEAYYRTVLPQARLRQQLTQGGAVSDAEVWQEFRDRNETATVTYVSVDPAAVVPDTAITVSDEEMRAYYQDHRKEYVRPATATVNVVNFSTTPTARDTMAARERADSVRAEILAGRISFEEAAASESADTATAGPGGRLGRFGRGQLTPPIEEAAFALRDGQISEPVLSSQGYHLLKVTDRTRDSVTVAHILFPIRLMEESEDSLFDQMDALEGIALIDGLEAAADSLGVPIQKDVTLTEGFDFVPGAGVLGVAVEWALDPTTPLHEVSEFFENATGYHMLEVTGRREGGGFSFEEVRDQIRQTLAAQKRKQKARGIAETAAARMRSAGSLRPVADSLGWEVQTAGPFTRRDFVPGLGRGTEALGAAFGVATGEIAGPFDAGDGFVILRVDDRKEADPLMFEATKEQLRAQLALQRAQENYTRWLTDLRETAEIVDRRDRLARPATL